MSDQPRLTDDDYRAAALEALRNLEASKPAAPGASAQERRRLIRMGCNLTVDCRAGARTFQARARDVSLGGMRLVSGELSQGLDIEVRPSTEPGEWVAARVMWYSQENSAGGILFQEEPERLGRSWVVNLLHELGLTSSNFVNRRRYTRAAAKIPVEVRHAEHVCRGQLADLGLGGTLLALNHRLEVNTEVEMAAEGYRSLPGLELHGKVLFVRELDGGMWGHSLEFGELKPDTTRLLGRYVVDLLRRPAE